MTVKELIEKLNQINLDAEVLIITANGSYYKVISCEEEYNSICLKGNLC